MRFLIINLLFISITCCAHAADENHQGMHDHHPDGAEMHVAAEGETGTARTNKVGRNSWSNYPMLSIKMGGASRASRTVSAVPQNFAAASIEAYSNNIDAADAHRKLDVDLSGGKFEQSSTGGFHMLIARGQNDAVIEVASTVYYNGERSARNPTEMFLQQKSDLEVIPQRFPREHSRYRANETWNFLVRFNGQPLADQRVNLETSNGTHAELKTDASGILTLKVPDDFKEPDLSAERKSGHDHGNRRGSDFVLAVRYSSSGKSYLTTFNSSYGPDAFNQRNLAFGVGFVLLGMIAATPLVRKRKEGKADNGEISSEHKGEQGNA